MQTGVTFDQVRGPIERLAIFAFGWFAAKGYIPQGIVGDLVTMAVAGAAAFYGWWQNRPKAILQSAAAIPAGEGKKTQVFTSPELAQATPNEPNIISNLAPTTEIVRAIQAKDAPK